MSDRALSPREDEGRGRSRSASPIGRRSRSISRSRSRSRSPIARDRSRSPARGGGDWKATLEDLYSKGDYFRKGDIEDRIISELEDMPAADAADVIRRFGEADLAGIKNFNGFISGIIRRVRNDSIGGGSAGPLPGSVQDILDDLIKDGKLTSSDVDDRVSRALSNLGESKAKEALSRYESSYDGTIRSPQGFLMGIIKRLGGNNGGGRGGYGGGRGFSGRGRYDDRDGDRRGGYGGGYSRGGGRYDRDDRRGYDRDDRRYDDRDDRRGGYGSRGGGDRRYDDDRRGDRRY